MTPFNISSQMRLPIVQQAYYSWLLEDPLATDAQSTIPEVVRILRSDFCINYLLTDLDKLEELFKHLIGATGQQGNRATGPTKKRRIPLTKVDIQSGN